MMLVTRGGGLIWKSKIWVIQIWITPLFGGGLFSKLEIWVVQIWITPLFRGGLFKYFWHSSFKYHLNHIKYHFFALYLLNFSWQTSNDFLKLLFWMNYNFLKIGENWFKLAKLAKNKLVNQSNTKNCNKWSYTTENWYTC